MSDDIEDDEEDGSRRVLSNRQVLGFVGRFWLRRKGLFFGGVTLMLIAVGLDLSLPWAAGRLVDAVSAPAGQAAGAWVAWAFFVGIYLSFTLIRILSFRFWNVMAANNMRELTDEAFGRVQSFSADWHADNFAGATVRRLTRAMWGYDSVSDAVVLMLGPAVIVLIGLSVMMGLRWPIVGLFSFVVVTLYLISNLTFATWYVRPANLRSTALDSKIGAAMADAVSANPTVKSFGAEAREQARLSDITGAWAKAVVITWNRFVDVWLIHSMMLVALQAGLSGLMVWLWANDRATPGDVAFAIAAFMLMSGYLRNVGENVRMMQKGLDDAQDVAAYAREQAQVPDAPGAAAFKAERGLIAFDHVTFGYKGAERPLYDDFSLVIAPGEKVALVGATGAGKSTFVKLVQRLYDLSGGRILIDGQDVSKVTQGSLRQAIALVPQDPALFHRSIAENIAYARPDAPIEDVIEAAKRARAHDFISRLPLGYDTLVGERGVKLSGGERQRVAIARAFLADAPILVLDEATSSLDVETELQVQAATEALMSGRTTIVIAHRLSTIRDADRILVFENGRVVEEGKHAQLKAQGGLYARLNAVAEGTV
ncbi:ABC transporter ATP-binding protein [Caulobacter segnis]|uniref:ABC transporter ATP-binding protein n=1 Tax=Caulobacter segnis TaxID=88688 RepID=UPI00240F9F16|nr:ABC transporter ATP-binding protein [Caulobacter segnis]MDG2520126.1 ABC transporter ATP-binding protein [Caulobacter segnis]